MNVSENPLQQTEDDLTIKLWVTKLSSWKWLAFELQESFTNKNVALSVEDDTASVTISRLYIP